MSRFYKDGNEVDFVAAAETAIGTLVQIGGQAGIVNPTNDGSPVANGATGVARIKGIVIIPNSGVVFAEGATVGYDQTNDEAVAAAGGDFDCGTCVEAAGATDEVKVLLNAN